MKLYLIERTVEKPYAAVIVGTSSESVHSFWKELEDDLKKENINGKVLVDCLLHCGNSNDRFFEIDFNKKLEKSSAKSVILDRESHFRRLANQMVAKNPQIIKNSILNDYQKKLLLKNISL